MDVCFSDITVKWLGRSIDLKPGVYFHSSVYYDDIMALLEHNFDDDGKNIDPYIGYKCYSNE